MVLNRMRHLIVYERLTAESSAGAVHLESGFGVRTILDSWRSYKKWCGENCRDWRGTEQVVEDLQPASDREMTTPLVRAQKHWRDSS